MAFELPPLPYDYDSLEPYIDEETMKIHHDKHHKAYTDKLNVAIEGNKDLQNKSAEEILTNINEVPPEIKQAVINNGGGYVNHSFFWEILEKDKEFSGEIAEAINSKFGGFEGFKEEFKKAATTLFGSGWTWLVLNKGELEIIQTKNQDSPLSLGKTPLIALDVWEHAYYLKYQNKRPDYIEAFFNVINWEKVNELFLASE
ncbi:MAG: superoxide dismutase [Nanoarchaeota archaeon]|nr:superoxide dismutase [Nanoarchaeota archaeon]